MEVTRENQSDGIEWGGYGVYIGPETGIGTGKTNTETIVRKFGDGNYAAKLCYDLVLGGKDDWFLPSTGELHELYKLSKRKYDPVEVLVPGDYWTSTSLSTYGNGTALFHRYNGSNSFSYSEDRDDRLPVRAIRYFSADDLISTDGIFITDTTPINTHLITFNSNGGRVAVPHQRVPDGGYAEEPFTPTKGGHIFRGWHSDSSLVNTWSFASDRVDGDMTLHARWEAAPGSSGGIVFYDKGTYSDGWRYLEAAKEDQSTGIEWGGVGKQSVSGTGTDIGTGRANTEAIVGVFGEPGDGYTNLRGGSYAARLCYDLDLYGEDDWFLPSRDELNELYRLYKQKDNSSEIFASAIYWSSSEMNNSFEAWSQNLGSGYQYEVYNNLKLYERHVRAIRAF